MKRSATHRTCDDEEWIEGRSKEIIRNNQDGATNRYVSSTDIYRAGEVSFRLPSEPLQLRLKYYLNNQTNPQWQGQVRPSFCLEHLTSPKQWRPDHQICTVVKAIKLLAGLCISIIEWLTVDHCLYPSHAGHERVMFFGIFVPITIKRNLKAVLLRYSYIGPA